MYDSRFDDFVLKPHGAVAALGPEFRTEVVESVWSPLFIENKKGPLGILVHVGRRQCLYWLAYDHPDYDRLSRAILDGARFVRNDMKLTLIDDYWRVLAAEPIGKDVDRH
jgi:hypothetical protein